MDHVDYFTDMFQPKPDYRKIVFLQFFRKIDVDSLHECGYLKNGIYGLCKVSNIQ